MANDYLTIADNVADACDLADNELVELKDAAPLLARIPMVESSNGATHKYSKRTANPVVGFRTENDGREFDHSVDTVVTVTLKILDFSFQVDKAVADAWRAGGAPALLAREGLTHLKAALFQMEKQLIQGTNNVAAGFAGFEDSAHLDATTDAMVVDAGGTTASTGSSCYLLRANEQEVASVMKGDGGIELGDTIVQSVAGSTGFYPAYYTPGCAWVAGQQGSMYSIARICNLTEDSGTGLTDNLIYDAVSRFPAGMGPNLIVSSARSAKQLRNSRTATNATGSPAPSVADVNGIPFITSDGISDTETLL
jgi:hypothetical protein